MSDCKPRYKMKQSLSDRIFDIICNSFLVFFVVIVFYPVYFVVVASFSDPVAVNNGDFLLYPVKFTIDGYRKVFENSKVWTGYFNTIIYTAGSVVLGIVVTMMAAYALARKNLVGRNIIMKLLVFTMYFSGGMIPLFLVVTKLGLINTRFVIILLGSVSVYNIIVARTFLMSNIPDELLDAARMDGCGNANFFIKVVIPLSKAVIAVIVMYIAVGQWNSYFNAVLYLTDSAKNPLQMFLRETLLIASTLGNVTESEAMDPEYVEQMRKMAQVLKYSLIVVSTAPIICIYPLVQKYFVKGVMIGSVKG